MDPGNYTLLTEFVLLGISDLPKLNALLFVVIAMFYFINVAGNISIITVVMSDSQLHTPMYFFLANLSVLDICISTVTIPKMLTNFLMERNTISFECCFMQLYFFQFFGSTEAFLLVAMSYDRYVAICHPLRYTVIMNGRVCGVLAFCSWTGGGLHSLLHTLLTARLPFCTANRISHFVCDLKPLLKLVCANTYINELLVIIITGFAASGTFLLITLSYAFISSDLLKIKSAKSRQKAFSTCASHLTIVIFYLVPASYIYLSPSTKDSLNQEMMATIFYTVVTPTLNPFIYTLRNKEVKRSMKKLIFQNPI